MNFFMLKKFTSTRRWPDRAEQMFLASKLEVHGSIS